MLGTRDGPAQFRTRQERGSVKHSARSPGGSGDAGQREQKGIISANVQIRSIKAEDISAIAMIDRIPERLHRRIVGKVRLTKKGSIASAAESTHECRKPTTGSK